ncbi:DSPc-domain-containing protein, partial [Metschnikowia bicuspidata var. bicuspidata NRRL YB-4993]
SSSGSMNYSPRHSCKPSSLLSSRNINIQRLLLDTNTVQPSSVLLPPKKGKPLAIFIPSGTSPTMLPHNSIKTPVQEHLPTRYSPNPLLASAYAMPQYPGETPETLMMPEELQEVGLTSAYPQGPANVLNSVLYLYSDPKTSGSPIDINDFDLVVNVARECDDLSADFDDRSGTRKYLRVPWSHTSAILKELPTITQEIAAMDKPGKKILVHCQCGVLRSACVVVAYFMVKFKISVNEAYELLKSGTESDTETCSQKIRAEGNFVKGCERICPNMSLIFELMDFGDKL